MRLTRSPLLRLTWNELRRRKVTRAAAVYALVAWVILQLAEITYDPLGLPGWALTWTVLGAVLGFPVVLVLAWFFDVSSRGIVREHGVAGATGRMFALVVVLFTVAGVGWWLSTIYGTGTGGDDARAGVHSDAPANAIAVLPFDDMSPQRDHRHLADGIAEELLDRLARMQGLRVAARTSSFALRDFAGDVREIGRLLNVRWVLEGSVRKAEGRVRITAQLIDAADGYHVWSETYDRPDQDLFALQDEVTEAIAGQLARRVGGIAGQAAGEMSTRSPEALELYLQGRLAWRQRTPASLEQAETLFQQAVARDPEFAHAWAGLADTYLLQADYGIRPLDEAIVLAEPAAVRAVTLRPQLGEAWATLGLLRSSAGQREAGKRSLEEAMRLDPRYEMAPMWLAAIYGREGRLDRQREVLERAVELNPLEPVINSNYANLLAGLGEVAAARDVLDRVLAITPDDPLLLRSLAQIELNAGRLARALELARRAHAVDARAPASVALLVEVLAALEDFAAAETLARQLPERNPLRPVLLQSLGLRRGESTVQPALAERAQALLGSGEVLTDRDRDAMLMVALAWMRGGDPAGAAALLRAVVGEPERVREEAALLDAASVLVRALQLADEPDEAARYDRVLGEVAGPWLAQAGQSATIEYARALLALHDNDRAGALAQLQRAYDAGFRQRWLLDHDPRLDVLRDAPELARLSRRIGDELAGLRQSLAAR
ncbi:tetratricopeptide repeat protein [Rehaibacterium terrae]|jgi:TolB-like protein/tetratricopeptide (TPR) repeat protein|uniref:TolB-like protein/tetratricopeptide (TPR) repeat protein n=2 Tax=Rehaibacterium terrae TaxID=1341696 RepID=A0A7W7Y143_9GAMM|nr:tetratricopeptide repeat protein [Rehaibacterium terrae]MBB5016176.1 TolB-like protein/tetratricopeptide (TPR) repeat protein [Rehaibacterium terrae]